MLKYLALYWVFFSSTAWATDCKKQPIYCHIIRVAPKTQNAMELSNQIVAVGKQLGVNPHLIVAIANQESGLRHIDRVEENSDVSGPKVIVTDFGILQVNVNSIKAYGLNADLLSWNREYQLWAGVKILAEKIRTFGHWSYYHSSRPSLNQKYRAAVGRYLNVEDSI